MGMKIASAFWLAAIILIALAFLSYVPRSVGWLGVGLGVVGTIIKNASKG